MRGKEKCSGGHPEWHRITPAYAGKSKYGIECRLTDAGSPPPMRGKVFYQIDQEQLPGITPAYAGKRATV